MLVVRLTRPLVQEHELPRDRCVRLTELVPVGDGLYRVSGKASIDDVNELLDVELPDEEWDTVAGLMLELFGRIPKSGDEVTFEGLTFTAEEVQGRRISKVLIAMQPDPDGHRDEVIQG